MARYRAEFFRSGSQWPRFYGLFKSRREAEAAADVGAVRTGYDHPEVAEISVDAMARTWTSDYPMLFWLAKLTCTHSKLFDLGGHIGTKYLAWRNYLCLREEFSWIVCDLPSIVAAGRERSKQYPQLSFTTDRNQSEGHQILLASGVLQYGDFDLYDLLVGLKSKPAHLLINKVPTHADQDAFTLENLHHSIVPYRIFNEEQLLGRLGSLGYAVEDSWIVYESAVRVPFTELGDPVHRGYYLRAGDRVPR